MEPQPSSRPSPTELPTQEPLLLLFSPSLEVFESFDLEGVGKDMKMNKIGIQIEAKRFRMWNYIKRKQLKALSIFKVDSLLNQTSFITDLFDSKSSQDSHKNWGNISRRYWRNSSISV
jgi:hypothetical protein